MRLLPVLPQESAARIAVLQREYGVGFEQRMSAASSLRNYEYLDILDRAWRGCRLPPVRGGTLVDIGCASFWYAAALQSFFLPEKLLGVEIEGHRLFRNGHSRIDYAQGYLAELPHARFMVLDYLDCEEPAEVITAWFPFVTPAALLAWRLPLELLKPERLLARIYQNLLPGGLLVMVNHGVSEAAVAEEFCLAAGFDGLGRFAAPGVLSGHRESPAVLSCWQRA